MIPSSSIGITLEELLLIVVIVLNLLIGIFVFARRPRNIVNQSFTLAVIGVSLWSLGIMLIVTNHQFEPFNQMATYGFFVLLTGFLVFAKTFPDGVNPNKHFFLVFIPLILLALTIPFHLIIQRAEFLAGGAIIPIQGPLFPEFSFISILMIVGSILLSIRAYKKSCGQARLQMNYLLFGLSVFLLTAGIFDVVLPAMGVFQLSFLGPASSIIFISLTAYAIIRHELLDIRIVIQRSLMYTIVLILIITVYLLLITLFGLILGATTDASIILSAGTTTALGITGMPIIQTYFQIWSDPIFFKNPYNYAEVVHSLSRILYTSLERNEIITRTAHILEEAFKASEVCFLFDTDLGTQIHQVPRVAGFYTAYQPIVFEKNIVGMLKLGPKKSGDAYTQKDAHLVATFAFQAAIALSKAELHEKVQNYSVHLEQLVTQRTNEIQKLQEEQKEAMITISHNLQTPLAVIRGEIELLSYHSENSGQLHIVQKSIDRVSGFIRQLLRVVRFEHSLDEHEMTAIALTPLLREQIDYFEVIAEDKNIHLSSKIEECGYIVGNKKLLEELITNLVANAMHYRAKNRTGKVLITLADTNSSITLTVSDNGIGIAENDIPHIFDRFYRAPQKPGSPAGSGLGLAIAKQIVASHSGSINVTSKLGEGTTFSIQFPKLSE